MQTQGEKPKSIHSRKLFFSVFKLRISRVEFLFGVGEQEAKR